LGIRKLDVTYKYTGSETREGRQLARIVEQADIRFIPPRNAKLKVDVKDRASTGLISFDVKAGRLVHKEEKENLKITITDKDRTIEEELQSTVSVKLNP